MRTSGRREHGRSGSGRPRRACDICATSGKGRGGVRRARRLWVRDRLQLRAGRGTRQPSLLASAPYFFQSTLTCPTPRYGIIEHQSSRAKNSRKYRMQRWAGCVGQWAASRRTAYPTPACARIPCCLRAKRPAQPECAGPEATSHARRLDHIARASGLSRPARCPSMPTSDMSAPKGTSACV